MSDEKPSDELVEWMADVLNNCHRTGMILPYIVSSICPNRSATVVRMDGENVGVLAEHYEAAAFGCPYGAASTDHDPQAQALGFFLAGALLRLPELTGYNAEAGAAQSRS